VKANLSNLLGSPYAKATGLPASLVSDVSMVRVQSSSSLEKKEMPLSSEHLSMAEQASFPPNFHPDQKLAHSVSSLKKMVGSFVKSGIVKSLLVVFPNLTFPLGLVKREEALPRRRVARRKKVDILFRRLLFQMIGNGILVLSEEYRSHAESVMACRQRHGCCEIITVLLMSPSYSSSWLLCESRKGLLCEIIAVLLRRNIGAI
jgi:hypothetical protein